MKEEEKLIQNIVKIRSSKGLTKRSMSEALNINEASYGRIENGKVALSYSQIAKIATKKKKKVITIFAPIAGKRTRYRPTTKRWTAPRA